MGLAYFQRSKTMNIKLHTPKSLKTGSGMSSWRQFLLSILATTVSIALTFGTAAVVDHNKKQKEKREIVMMVLYDMHNSLKSVEKADSMLRMSMDLQLKVAEDTTKFSEVKFKLLHCVPKIDYTETTERIFSTSIETINTVGSVLFTENVAEFYQARKYYKTMVCDSVAERFAGEKPYTSLKGLLDFQYFIDAIVSGDILQDMQHLYDQCKQMMDVTDEEIEAYRKERKEMENSMPGIKAEEQLIKSDMMQLQEKIDSAKKKYKLE